MPTPVSDVPYLRLKDIKRRQKSHSPQASSAVTSHECAPNAEELSAFYTELASCSKKSILLSTVAPHNVEFVQFIDHLPRALQGLYDANNLKLNFTQPLELTQQFKDSVTPAMRDHLEVITRTPASCRKWLKYHAGRVTASNLHAVVHTSPHQQSISLLKNICYPEVYIFKNDTTEWGCLHEKEALESYIQVCHVA